MKHFVSRYASALKEFEKIIFQNCECPGYDYSSYPGQSWWLWYQQARQMSDICTTVAGGNRHTSERVSADLRIGDAEINIENTKTTGSKKLKISEKPSEDDAKSSTEGFVLFCIKSF